MAKKEKYIKVKKYKNSTYYTVQFTYESLGKKCSYSKTFSTMKEAIRHRDLKRAELITQGLPSGARTIEQLFEDYLRINRVKKGTADRKKFLLNHCPELKGMQIAKVKPLDIQRSLNALIYDYSDREIKLTYMVLSQICDTAILEGHLNVSPMGMVICPKSQKISRKRPQTASDSDIELVLSKLEEPTTRESSDFNHKLVRLFLEIMMYTGMRPSEVLALKRDNIHLDTLTIDVETRIGSDETSYGVETRLKTESSRRRVPMSRACEEVFLELLSMSANDYLFTMWGGKLLYTEYIQNTISKICNETGIDFHPYMLRHRAATKIIVEGKADPRTAMEILGHSNVSTTLNVYSHSNDAEKIKVIDMVEKSRKPS